MNRKQAARQSGSNLATPDGVSGSRYGGRVADIEGLGHTDVRITADDAPNLTLSYTVEAENIPDFPFESKYIDVQGSKMHSIDEGEGDPILFLHGNPMSS